MNTEQTKIELEKIYQSEIHISYYDGYTWFVSDDTQPDGRHLQIHFPEQQSYDDSYDLNDACFVLFDIDNDPIDEIKY